MHNFKELIVWKKSRELVKDVYLLIKDFPIEERYCLISQMHRCVISIPSNIAEGSGRNSEIDFSRFMDISYGSACELETQIILAFDLGYIEELQMNEINNKINEIQKMIYVFQQNILKKKQ